MHLTGDREVAGGGGKARDERRRQVELLQPLAQGDAADVMAHQQVADRQQHPAGDQEHGPVEQRQAQPDRGRRTVPAQPRQPAAGPRFTRPALHHFILYPTPITVSTTEGSPSLRRNVMIVIRTTLVNGSMCSSHTRSSRSSVDTAAPSALISTSSTANSLRASSTGRPLRIT